jgi:hypothetical protein
VEVKQFEDKARRLVRATEQEHAGEMHKAVEEHAMRINKNKRSCQLLARTGRRARGEEGIGIWRRTSSWRMSVA